MNETGNIPLSHFYSFQRMPEEELPRLFAEFAENGAKFLTLIHPWMKLLAENPEKLRFFLKPAEEAGLRYLNAHAPFSEDWDLNLPPSERRSDWFDRFEKLFGVCAEAGVRVLTCHIGRVHAGTDSRGLCRRALDAELVPLSKRFGVRLALENTLQPVALVPEILYYLECFEPDELGCCLDTGHLNCAPANPADLLRLRDRIFTTHLHDNHGKCDEHLLPGDGSIDWAAMLAFLAQAKNLESNQNETHLFKHGISISRACGVFRFLLGKC